MSKFTSPGSTLGALLLGSAFALASCAPAPIDKGGPSPARNGGDTAPAGTGGTAAPANTGGSAAPSGTGGSSPAGTGGSAPSGTGGTKPPGTGGGGGGVDMGGGMEMGTPAAEGNKVPAAVQAVFMKCGTTCHGGNWGDATKSFSRMNANAMGCSTKPRMVKGDPAGSLVVQVMKAAVGGCGRMPKNMPALSEAEIMTVEKWIMDGGKGVQ